MISKRIYIYHETGNVNHYTGLSEYCSRHDIECVFREFALAYQLKIAIKEKSFSVFLKFWVNLMFFCQLYLTKNKCIVLGAAPYDYSMMFFSNLAKRHTFFYHSSWINWDGSCVPKSTKILPLSLIKNAWKMFLEERCKGIFCVSQRTRREILGNYNISCPIQVVNHSIDSNIFQRKDNSNEKHVPLKCLFVGRVVEKKGVFEICELAKRLPKSQFGFVGDGEMLDTIRQRTKNLANVVIYGWQSKKNISSIMDDYDILLLPSKQGYGTWQELFGIALIEAMAKGLIPIATCHFGPQEILEHGVTGLLIEEDDLIQNLMREISYLETLNSESLREFKYRTISHGLSYSTDKIAVKWSEILKKHCER